MKVHPLLFLDFDMDRPAGDRLEAAKQLAIQYIDYAARTRAEVERRLAKAGFEEEIVTAVIADLVDVGLLDDAQFSQDWVESRARRKKLGRVRLAAELRQKGISKEDAQQAIGEIAPEDELAAALELARVRLGTVEAHDPGGQA